jgi:hypothetical protein
VYAGDLDIRNRYIPSAYIGDFADLTVTNNDRSNPPVGTTNIRIDYTPRGPMRFAGFFWTCPADNFGHVANAGFNLSGARRVRFFARASNANAQAEFKVGGLGRGTNPAPFPDSFDVTPTNPAVISLGTDWRELTIDLTGKNTSFVISGFFFVTSITQNPNGVSIFLANIVWE